MIVFIVFSIVALGIGIGCYASKTKYRNSIELLSEKSVEETLNTDNLRGEIDRIEELKLNLKEIRDNVDNLYLNIPTLDSIDTSDNAQSSLNKLSCFFEQHSRATVGAEQVILLLLPSSQIRESMRSLIHIIPPDIGPAVFGDAIIGLKESIQSLSMTEFLHRFVEGATHLSKMAMMSMKYAAAHHNILKVCFTPIKSGVMEALGVNDAVHSIVSSLHDIGDEMVSSAATDVDVSGLTSMTDFDISGHVPVVTIALSSVREIQLLSNDKTNYLTSLKNIALDAAGTGGGALIGAKAGAIAGSLFGPIGTIVGSIFGSIGGAMGGRTITNNIKIRPLKNAIAEYESQYSLMKSDTEEKSKNTARNIQSFAVRKRNEFHESSLLQEIPVVDTEQTLSQIALVLYQFVVNELIEWKQKASELRNSIWYSAKKYDQIISTTEKEIEELKIQLPPAESIKESPNSVIDALLNLDMPNRKAVKAYQDKINECCEELKSINDNNNSSILFWSYAVNNQYQETLNDIADYSNGQMKSLNDVFNNWKGILSGLENRISDEKGKLGLA